MNENFENNEFFRQLPEEIKEKLRNCKSEEEAMDILKEDMIPIPDDVLESVSGGEFYDGKCPVFCSAKAPSRKRGM